MSTSPICPVDPMLEGSIIFSGLIFLEIYHQHIWNINQCIFTTHVWSWIKLILSNMKIFMLAALKSLAVRSLWVTAGVSFNSVSVELTGGSVHTRVIKQTRNREQKWLVATQQRKKFNNMEHYQAADDCCLVKDTWWQQDSKMKRTGFSMKHS